MGWFEGGRNSDGGRGSDGTRGVRGDRKGGCQKVERGSEGVKGVNIRSKGGRKQEGGLRECEGSKEVGKGS